MPDNNSSIDKARILVLISIVNYDFEKLPSILFIAPKNKVIRPSVHAVNSFSSNSFQKPVCIGCTLANGFVCYLLIETFRNQK